MATYRNIHISFWNDLKIQDEMNIEERYFFLYLLTNPHTSQIGCYEITIRQIQFETGLDKEVIRKCLEKFENDLNIIEYSNETTELLIKNWYKYNLTKSPKMYTYIQKEIKNIKNNRYKKYIETVCIPYIYGIDTISETKEQTENDNEKYGIDTVSQKEKKIKEEEKKIINITKLNETFIYILNNNIVELNIEENTFNGFIHLIERLDFKLSIEHMSIMSEEQIIKFKIIYIVLFSLWKNSYEPFLNKLSREKIINKLSKTEEKLGKIKDITEEKVGEHLLYFYKCLKNDFDARS